MRNNKKGFTIIELVIVIAVIAILAGVMIPTFSGIINKGKESSAMQQATAAYHAVLGVTEEGTLDVADVEIDAYVKVDDKCFKLVAGELTVLSSTPSDVAFVESDATLPTDAGTYYVRAKLLYSSYFEGTTEDPAVYVYYNVPSGS